MQWRAKVHVGISVFLQARWETNLVNHSPVAGFLLSVFCNFNLAFFANRILVFHVLESTKSLVVNSVRIRKPKIHLFSIFCG